MQAHICQVAVLNRIYEVGCMGDVLSKLAPVAAAQSASVCVKHSRAQRLCVLYPCILALSDFSMCAATVVCNGLHS